MASGYAYRLRAQLLAGIAWGVLGAAPASAQVITDYYYDALGRLVAAVNSDGKTVGYGYDPAGNRIRVSNDAMLDEIRPTVWSATNSIVGTGLSTPNGMRDAVFNAPATIHATTTTANSWIMANFGALKHLDHVDLAPGSYGAYGIGNLNGMTLQWSANGSTWTTVAAVSGATSNTYVSIPVGGVNAQYVRLLQPSTTAIAVGDFRFYSNAAAPNHPPIADSFPITMQANSTATIDLTTHIRDPDNNPLSLSSVNVPTAAQHGTATQVANINSITYVPVHNYGASDAFSYTISDGKGASATGLITVNIQPNHPPVAVADSYGVNPNDYPTLAPLSNDSDPDTGDVLHLVSVAGTQHGVIQMQGDVFVYQVQFGFRGTDTFTYVVSDNHDLTTNGSGTINVDYGAGPNRAPATHADSLTVPFNGTGDVDPTLNDTDADLDTLSVTAVTQPSTGGTVTFTSKNVHFVAATGFSGQPSFSYTVSDGRGGTAVGTVSVTVGSGNHAPVANLDTVSGAGNTDIAIYALANDTDPDGDTLKIVSVGQPAYGTALPVNNGQYVSYRAPQGYLGTQTFSYAIQDPSGATASSTITVTTQNNPPTTSPVPYEVTTSYQTPSAAFDPRLSPTDYDGQAVTIVGFSGSPAGTPVVSGGGTSVIYTPPTGFSGVDTFNYVVQDTLGAQASGPVRVTVSPPSAIGPTTSASSWSGGRTQGQPGYYATPIAVTTHGGTGPYSYEWQYVSGQTVLSVVNLGNGSATWYYSGTAVGSYSAYWRCKVTDSQGLVGYTGDVFVEYSLENNL
jgi:YD repeat-containing protein